MWQQKLVSLLPYLRSAKARFPLGKPLKKNQTLNFFKKGGGVNTKVNIFEIKFLTKVEYRIFKPGEQTECFDVKVSKI